MLKFTHGNREGTGSQMTVDIVPAGKAPNGTGFALVSLLPQDHSAAEGMPGNHVFLDECALVVPLTAKDLAHLLIVLDGRRDSILNGKGLRLRRSYDSAKGAAIDEKEVVAVMHCDRVSAPYAGYAVHVKTLMQGDNGAYYWEDGRIVLNEAEATALRDSLRSSMGRIAFCK